MVLALQLQWLTRKSFPHSMTSMPNGTPALISPSVASSTPHLPVLLPVSYFSVSTIFLSFIFFFSEYAECSDFNLWRKSCVLFSFLGWKHHIYIPSYSFITLIIYLIFFIKLTLHQNLISKFLSNLLPVIAIRKPRNYRPLGKNADVTTFCVCLLSREISFTAQVWYMCHIMFWPFCSKLFFFKHFHSLKQSIYHPKSITFFF